MKFIVNGAEVQKDDIGVNTGLNFGRFENVEIFLFEIRVSKKDIIFKLNRFYTKVLNEIKNDDEKYNDTSVFKESGYAPLAEVLDKTTFFEPIFTTYLDVYFYEKAIGNNSNCTFILNATDSVEIKNNVVIITGRAFKK